MNIGIALNTPFIQPIYQLLSILIKSKSEVAWQGFYVEMRIKTLLEVFLWVRKEWEKPS